MDFKEWLSKEYKTPTDEKLIDETIELYVKMLEEIKTYLRKVENIGLTSLSLAAMQKVYDRLSVDEVFKNLTNGELMLRVLNIYIQYRNKDK